MSYLALFFLICCIVGGSFLAWLYTKPGEKWLKDLESNGIYNQYQGALDGFVYPSGDGHPERYARQFLLW